MIYEFQATQSFNGYDEPWAPGSKYNKLDFAGMVLGEPSNTASSSATARTWTEGTFIKGVNPSNYYVPTNISAITKTDTDITFTSTSTSYGVALVLPELTPGDTYTFSVNTESAYLILNIMYYDADGALLESPASISGKTATFTVPENVKYTLVLFRTTANASITMNEIMLEEGSVKSDYLPYANVCMPEGYNIWDPDHDEFIQVYAGYVNANTRELYLRPVYEEYAGEELVGPWMSSWDKYAEDATPTEGAFVIDFGGELTSLEITPFMLQTLLDSLGIRQHFTDGAGLLNKLMDQAQGRVRSEEELLHLSRPLNVIAIGDQLPAGITFKPISKDVLPGLPGKFIR